MFLLEKGQKKEEDTNVQEHVIVICFFKKRIHSKIYPHYPYIYSKILIKLRFN